MSFLMAYRLLHIIAAVYFFESAENYGVMGDDAIAVSRHCFIDHLRSRIQRAQNARTFPLAAARDEAGIVVTFLQYGWSDAFERMDDVGDFHARRRYGGGKCKGQRS